MQCEDTKDFYYFQSLIPSIQPFKVLLAFLLGVLFILGLFAAHVHATSLGYEYVPLRIYMYILYMNQNTSAAAARKGKENKRKGSSEMERGKENKRKGSSEMERGKERDSEGLAGAWEARLSLSLPIQIDLLSSDH
eukprot:SAG31_NODE_6570_length_1969_cov_1.276471_2_plen_136_part_00